MQLQSDERGVARRARAVVRNSSESPGVNSISMAIGNENVDFRVSLFHQEQADDDNKKTYCLVGIVRAEDEDTSLAIDTQQQHNNHHRKQWQPAGQTVEERKEEKGQGEREKGRKDEGGRGQEGKRKEKEREAEVKKDVTDWTVVTRNRRQRKMVQIFVKVNGSKRPRWR